MYFFIFFSIFFLAATLCRAKELSYEPSYSECELKVAFIYNFLKFVRWPDNYFPNDKTSINICIYGSGCPSEAFHIIEGKTVQGYTLTKKSLRTLSGVDNCDVLFICSSERHRINQIINRIKNMPVLTIGDTEGFAEKGVIINFYMEDNKLRFEINVDAAREAKISISSHLLKLARIIRKQK